MLQKQHAFLMPRTLETAFPPGGRGGEGMPRDSLGEMGLMTPLVVTAALITPSVAANN